MMTSWPGKVFGITDACGGIPPITDGFIPWRARNVKNFYVDDVLLIERSPVIWDIRTVMWSCFYVSAISLQICNCACYIPSQVLQKSLFVFVKNQICGNVDMFYLNEKYIKQPLLFCNFWCQCRHKIFAFGKIVPCAQVCVINPWYCSTTRWSLIYRQNDDIICNTHYGLSKIINLLKPTFCWKFYWSLFLCKQNVSITLAKALVPISRRVIIWTIDDQIHWSVICITNPQYRKVSNIRGTKCQNLNDSRLVLQLSVPNPLKPSVESIMKM